MRYTYEVLRAGYGEFHFVVGMYKFLARSLFGIDGNVRDTV